MTATDTGTGTDLAELVGIDVPTELVIGGQWRPAATGGTFDVLDPATERLLATVADGDVADAVAAVESAAAAAADWAGRSPRDRAEILRRAFDAMTEQAEALARLIVLENGKTLVDARGEVGYAAEFFRWYADEAVRLSGELTTSPNGANRIMVVRQPIGVAVLVTPWNFPAAMATRKIAPALAAGCTVVLKPAAETPLTALLIGRLLEQAGVPDGVVNIVTTERPGPAVSAMLADPRVRKLSFTGSTGVGRTLLAEAAKTVVSCSMELGGNAPFVVFADADLDAAVEGAMVAKMRNGGEACTAANRFLVERSVMADFAERFAAAMAAQSMGSGLDDGVRLGPLVSPRARDKVAGLVTETVAAGARIVTGGEAPEGTGWFYPPTVLADVPVDAPVMREEIFGPVAPLVAFDTEEEAVRLANDTEYGLVSYVYSGDLARALRVAEAFDSGMVGINRGLVSDPAAPFGGTKQSGLGREGGHEGMLEYTESKYIALSW